jgi:hypothetical protein
MSDEAIFQAETNSMQRLLSRRCKNVEDCHVSATHFLAMTVKALTEMWVRDCRVGVSRLLAMTFFIFTTSHSLECSS